MLEKIFKLKEHNTTVRTEFVAGFITFLTMAYILMVNPTILGETGMPKGALFTATALTAIIGTLLMAFLANLPVAQASGMGLNTFFAVNVVLKMGYSWQFALTAVFLEGLIFVFLTFFNVRELIMKSIPLVLKNAIPVGIGLFIALIGLKSSGIVVSNPHTLLEIGDMANPNVWVGFIGIFTAAILMARGFKAAILVAIVVSTILAALLGVFDPMAEISKHDGIMSIPPSIAPIFMKFEWGQVFTFDMLIVVFTFLLINLFDTIGTLIGVVTKAGFLDKDGNFPQARKALFADALGTTAGAICGTSTVTAYVESSAGVAIGGRTGLTAVSTAIMFCFALFFAPLFLMVPASATAPALIIVGLLMMSSVVKIDFDDITESLPAFVTIIFMPFTYSISQGIIFGILSFVIMKLFAGKQKDISIAIYTISLLFIIKIILDATHLLGA
ncbi:MAG: hypothetical protein RL662_65 [Bacteroidota bacterium]|jgi:AGZA family xanthine/uracil permease-like MFS transporter